MKIAILGATSQIARDLITSYAAGSDNQLYLYARRPDVVRAWLVATGLSGRYPVDDFSGFSGQDFDAIINFVGVGDPARAKIMGSSIFEITYQYDQMALDYVKLHPSCKYIFLSSGAVYGDVFSQPVTEYSVAQIPINHFDGTYCYTVAKLHAEARHRSLPDYSIVDVRVFNYFSHTQDMSARFFITDIVHAIRDKEVLKISPDYIMRDFLHPSDFYNLVNAILCSSATNAVVDCCTRSPIDKPSILAAMQEKFGLKYEYTEAEVTVNATGSKPNYYSLNRRAEDFGYRPVLTSLEGILKESETLLGRG